MIISVFTPTNDPSHLDRTYHSLAEQSFEDWEWVVLLNGGAEIPRGLDIRHDSRVKAYTDVQSVSLDRVGALKRLCCERAEGDIFLELDHDDLLAPDALAKVHATFAEDDEVGFVYSNCARIGDGFTPAPAFNPAYGWQERDVAIGGVALRETISPAPVPQNLGSILFAPDHLRAWRREAYWRAGGHDQALAVGDDHDLICRTYLSTKMRHLDECLYIYRITGANSWLKNVDRIAEQSDANWERYKWEMALEWARANRLRAIDLCGGIDSPAGFESVDRRNADVVCDLNEPWPFDWSSVGVIRAFDAIEHLRNPIHTMNEAWRVLAHGGFLFSMTPSADGKGAFCDPTHVSFWNDLSFRYYTSPRFRRYIEPECGAKFLARRVRNLEAMVANGYDDRMARIPYVQADLIAVKDGTRFHGLCEW